MPKMKTKKSLAKRVTVKSNGTLKELKLIDHTVQQVKLLSKKDNYKKQQLLAK
uniref:50S ribosomal protein L35 n=1 Tax=Mycoplasma feriruminatoris TaxID=1179777 RepID=A0A654IBN9_9MOLU|nr:hypothetical protein MF5292_00700 [Mycoplasma feriruminatoris]